jgi:hypothetical protein
MPLYTFPSRADWQTMARDNGWLVDDSTTIPGVWTARRGLWAVEVAHNAAGDVTAATVDGPGGEEHLGVAVRGTLLGSLAATFRSVDVR